MPPAKVGTVVDSGACDNVFGVTSQAEELQDEGEAREDAKGVKKDAKGFWLLVVA